MAEEAAEGSLNVTDLSWRGGEEAALEDKGGEKEGAGDVDTLKEARVERGPRRCLANQSPLLMAKGLDLQVREGGGNWHPQVPSRLPLPGDRDEKIPP
jgi:hypothetical protein